MNLLTISTSEHISNINQKKNLEYQEKILRDACVDPIGFWRFIKSKTKGSGIPDKLKYKGTSFEGALNAANAFAYYFLEVFNSRGPQFKV